MGTSTCSAGLGAWWRFAIAALCFSLAILIAPVSATAAETLKGVALVIGNGDYEHLSKLPNPENDANDVEQLLDKLGFDTTATTDRDARRLKRDLEGFADDAEGADIAVLYYSGHGIEAGGRNFLVPVDADLSSLDNAGDSLVAVDALIEKLKAEVPIVIVFLDACRNNPFPPDAMVKLAPGGEALPIAVSGLGASRSAVALNPTADSPAPDANVGVVLAFAAEPGKVALDGDPGGHSPYAAALLRHLSAMSGDEFGLVMRMVAEEVYLKTQGQQRPWVNESMRRLLYLGQTPDQPTGAEGDILAERRGLLVTIAALPDRERRTIEAVATDTGVPMDALYGMLKALGSEVPQDSAQLDSLLRGQTEKVKAMIAERDTLKSTDPEIIRLSALADEALAEGALTTAIDLRQQAKARAKEVEATVDDAESQLRQRRIELAEVYAKSAESYALAFKHREAAQDYEEAARQVDKWDDEKAFWYTRSAATAYLEAGKLRGGAPDLKQAAQLGQSAAAMADRLLASRQDDRQYWEDISAQTLNNLANASYSYYYATKQPSALDDAANAYERSLKVLNRDRVPEDWAVVQNNLAGALMTLGQNESDAAKLERSIEAYHQALTIWTRESSPLRWALATANLGLVQTALGVQNEDEGMLRQSVASFQSALEVQTQENADLDWASTQAQLSSAYAALGQKTRDQADFDKSIAASQEALKAYTLDRTPRLWASTFHDMAVVIGNASTPDTREAATAKAAAIYEQIIAAISRDEQPNEYALSAWNLAHIRLDTARRHKDSAAAEQAIAMLTDVAAIYEKMERPIDTAGALIIAGDAQAAQAKLRERPDEFRKAIATFERAQALYSSSTMPELAERVRPNLASSWENLAYRLSVLQQRAEASAAYRKAFDYRDREKDPKNWLFTANQLGIALKNLGDEEKGVDTLREAATVLRLALSATPPEAPYEDLTATRRTLANTLRSIAERSKTSADYLAQAEALDVLVTSADKMGQRDGRNLDQANRAAALLAAGEIANDPKLFEQAAFAYRDAFKLDDMPEADRLFHTINYVRTLFFHASASGGDAARKEAVALIDASWPMLEKSGSSDQKVNTLLDRANLLSILSANDPKAYPRDMVQQGYDRAAALTDSKVNLAQWQIVKRFIADYQLNGLDTAGFPQERLQTGLGTLRSLLDSTPRQNDPQAWAELANWYGYALSIQGKRENKTASFEEAVPILRDAISAFEGANDAASTAHTQDSLCGALVGLGRIQKQRALVAEGAQNCDKAVAYMRANNVTRAIPIVEANLSDARKALAELGQP